MKTINRNLLLVGILSFMFTSLQAQNLNINPKFIENTYNIEVGDIFDINIKGNRTTGYGWYVVNICEGGIVEQVKYDYKVDEHPPGWAGGGGTEIWTLKASKIGTAILKFELFPGGEPNKIADVKFFKINVIKYDYEISVNESFVIPITANHTTPYRWAWLNESQTKIVKNTDKKYIVDPHPDDMAGVGGKEHWTFKALSPGEVVLKFAHTEGDSRDRLEPKYHNNNEKSPTYKLFNAKYYVKVKSKTIKPKIVVKNVLGKSHPPIPKGLRIDNQTSTNKVVEADGLTYWAYSYIDNRNSFGIVAYDNKGKVVNQIEKKGARYLRDIKLNSIQRTVEFIGQASKKVTMHWDEFFDISPKPNENFTHDLLVGETFEIALKANYTTPYTWTWLNESSTNKVKKLGAKYILDHDDGRAGGGGVDYWTYEAVKPGIVELKFGYSSRDIKDISQIGVDMVCRVNIRSKQDENVNNTTNTIPIVKTVSASNHPPIPKGLKPVFSSTCKVIEANGLTYWAYSYIDNRYSFGIVAYDNSGKVVNQFEKRGARYLKDIKLNTEERTVEFIGQASRKVTMDWDEFFKDSL